MNSRTARRTFLGTSTIAATDLLLVGCKKKNEDKSEIEVTAAEDLMREHAAPDQYDERNDNFEDIEHQQFGKDGFEDAVNQMDAIAESIGISDLAQFTAPLPN